MTPTAQIAAALLTIATLPAVFVAQSKHTPKTKPKVKTTAPSVMPQPTPAATPEAAKTPPKRNERPGGGKATPPAEKLAYVPVYFYQFDRPGFTYPTIAIEHDDAGRGQIAFVKDGNDVGITDPIELSSVTLANLRGAFTALNFLDSNENYQYQRDYSNMGNVTITIRKDGRSRSAKYNWTENKNARILMDEYRRISNEYIWRFEITSARENQPLLAPQLMQQMDDYIRRNEISDPPHLIPLFRELSNDERIPLIARDHAAKFAAAIEKQKK